MFDVKVAALAAAASLLAGCVSDVSDPVAVPEPAPKLDCDLIFPAPLPPSQSDLSP